jgi:hypothetical protein
VAQWEAVAWLFPGVHTRRFRLWLLKRPFLLCPLMLRATTDTLLGDDVRAALASTDRPRTAKFAGCLASGGADLASPVAGPATIATAAPETARGGPLALGVPGTREGRLARSKACSLLPEHSLIPASVFHAHDG